MPQLLDPNFRRSVVLLVHHDAEGTFGVVLNRTTEITASRLCDSLDLRWNGDPRTLIHWGGPVQPQTGWVLCDEESALEAPEELKHVGEGVYFAGSLDVLRHVVEEPPRDLRVMLGYAGWGPGQLESELAQGAWLLAPVEREVVFEVESSDAWEHVVRGLGIEPATLIATRGIH